MTERFECVTEGEEETRALGSTLAQALKGGERIGLSGELGAGKTCFVRGLAEGLGIAPEQVRSPSFTLMAEYGAGRLPLYHLDLFRIRPSHADRLALREYLYGPGVSAVEWYEHLGEPLEDFLAISLTFVGANSRRLVAVGHGLGYAHMLSALETAR
jgi:tRNA threonylcarbamoyladenosine biosynthesis protein TsaE